MVKLVSNIDGHDVHPEEEGDERVMLDVSKRNTDFRSEEIHLILSKNEVDAIEKVEYRNVC